MKTETKMKTHESYEKSIILSISFAVAISSIAIQISFPNKIIAFVQRIEPILIIPLTNPGS